jgi:hypothetical protein
MSTHTITPGKPENRYCIVSACFILKIQSPDFQTEKGGEMVRCFSAGEFGFKAGWERPRALNGETL